MDSHEFKSFRSFEKIAPTKYLYSALDRIGFVNEVPDNGTCIYEACVKLKNKQVRSESFTDQHAALYWVESVL